MKKLVIFLTLSIAAMYASDYREQTILQYDDPDEDYRPYDSGENTVYFERYARG